MELISVIMSVYNEKIEEFTQALKSIQQQSHKEIEIWVIIDNPERNDIVSVLSQLDDTRVRYIINKQNIGLALSMNLAAQKAQGKYLARMDADDISNSDRLEKELKLIKERNVDYVCSWYDVIDEEGNKKNIKTKMFRNKILNEMLPYCDTICHPTVLIKKEIFDAVGGYRNFPCAQDYDLWLRLYDSGYRAAVVEEMLLLYRVRSNSISSKKGLQQFYTAEYIKKLSMERRRKGFDSYSGENYQSFLNRKRVFDDDRISEFQQGKKDRNEKGWMAYLKLALKSNTFRKIIWNTIQCRFMKQWLNFFKRSLK